MTIKEEKPTTTLDPLYVARLACCHAETAYKDATANFKAAADAAHDAQEEFDDNIDNDPYGVKLDDAEEIFWAAHFAEIAARKAFDDAIETYVSACKYYNKIIDTFWK